MEDIEDPDHSGENDPEPGSGLDVPGYRGAAAPARSYPALAWAAIAACTILTVYAQNNTELPADDARAGNLTRDAMLDFQGRYWVAAAELARREGVELETGLEFLDSGDPSQRLRYLVLLGELEGPKRALEELEELRGRLREAGVELTEKQAAVSTLLESLWSAAIENEEPAVKLELDEKDRLVLTGELGWYGELARATFAPGGAPPPGGPHQGARETLNSAVVMFLCGGTALLLGVLALAFFFRAVAQKRLKIGIGGQASFGGIYLETFAVWMGLFILLNLVLGRLELAGESLYPALFMFFFSLAALTWPLLRGVSWARLRADIGLTTGKSAVEELIFGLLGYLMALPMMLLGVMFFLVIMFFSGPAVPAAGAEFEPVSYPSHPIMEWILADGGDFMVVVVLACVAAPIVEEIMFRGLLYRYLREASLQRGLFSSALISALVSSFLFAVIHPQGLAAVPILMGLAGGFCLVREWRASLLSSMVAHGLNNYIALSMTRFILGG